MGTFDLRKEREELKLYSNLGFLENEPGHCQRADSEGVRPCLGTGDPTKINEIKFTVKIKRKMPRENKQTEEDHKY